jgi:hypothetical protein
VAAILNGVTAYGPPFGPWPRFTPYDANGTCPDMDYDGVPDYAEELIIGTSPLRESSDKDKFDDGQELFGVTFCPAPSGPCGYGILPRAEDAAWVSANLTACTSAGRTCNNNRASSAAVISCAPVLPATASSG